MRLTNAACWQDAKRYLVGGVNSPVRSFKAVGSAPFFVDRGQGAYLWDVEGKRYLDYLCSWGALILGHRPAEVLKAVSDALKRGTGFGTPTSWETELAKEITQAVPSMEQVRFVSSGTEAVMSAIRLARAATGLEAGHAGRQKILKFDGAYHGHLDALLAKAGSGMATLGIPASAGVPASVTKDTITVSFNDPEAVIQAIRRHRKELACVLVEPILANVGVIPPEEGFLQFLRRITQEEGILLIFDEVITGFRVAYGGAQGRYQVKPDITVLGKAIGGGFPIGAYGASRRLMKLIAPAGPVYQAGTLAGHPVAMAAGLAILRALKPPTAVLKQPGIYSRLEEQCRRLQEGLIRISRKAGVPVTIHQVGGLLSLFFTSGPVRSAAEAKRADSGRYARYFRRMLDQGVYLPPSPFEAWFPSLAHGEREIEITLKAHEQALVASSRKRGSDFRFRGNDGQQER